MLKNSWTDDVLKQIKKHEGLRLKPYRCTEGYLTIGYGRSLDTNGISEKEAEILLENDVQSSIADVSCLFRDDWALLPLNIKKVLVDMRFQLGGDGFRSFKKMIKAVKSLDYDGIIREMLDSLWAKEQTPERANKLVDLIYEAKQASERNDYV